MNDMSGLNIPTYEDVIAAHAMPSTAWMRKPPKRELQRILPVITPCRSVTLPDGAVSR